MWHIAYESHFIIFVIFPYYARTCHDRRMVEALKVTRLEVGGSPLRVGGTFSRAWLIGFRV